jgi:hypothetical protein
MNRNDAYQYSLPMIFGRRAKGRRNAAPRDSIIQGSRKLRSSSCSFHPPAHSTIPEAFYVRGFSREVVDIGRDESEILVAG